MIPKPRTKFGHVFIQSEGLISYLKWLSEENNELQVVISAPVENFNEYVEFWATEINEEEDNDGQLISQFKIELPAFVLAYQDNETKYIESCMFFPHGRHCIFAIFPKNNSWYWTSLNPHEVATDLVVKMRELEKHKEEYEDGCIISRIDGRLFKPSPMVKQYLTSLLNHVKEKYKT